MFNKVDNILFLLFMQILMAEHKFKTFVLQCCFPNFSNSSCTPASSPSLRFLKCGSYIFQVVVPF